MEEKNKEKLDKLFEKIKEQEKKSNILAEKAKNDSDEFLKEFKYLCENVITPIMNDFRDYIIGKGMGCYVNFEEENLNKKGFYSKPNIKLEISKATDGKFYSENKYPHIMFIGDKHSKEISIHENTMFPTSGGHAGMKSNKYTINSLDKTKIEYEITDTIQNILKNKY